MKKKFVEKSIQFISKYKKYSNDDIEKLQYGLEGLYLTLTKGTTILLISFILGVLKETLLVLIFFNFLRFTGFGFHAQKSSQCFIFSVILFSIVPYLFFNIQIDSVVKWIIMILSYISLALYAPADTEKRPLPNKKKRKWRKISTIAIASIYVAVILIFFSQTISIILLISLLIESIMVHPITYRIFRQPYRNYQNYSVV